MTDSTERTFINSLNDGIFSYGDHLPEANETQYHFYSSPCLGEYFSGISNRFPGGIFKSVRKVSLYDEKPFDHQFFLRIANSFPSMVHLSVVNHKAQQRQQSDRMTNDPQTVSPIRCARLNFLDLVRVHDYYIEQFLLDNQCRFLQPMSLFVRYQALEQVVHQLSKDQVKFNSDQVTRLWFSDEYSQSHCIEEYFPHAKIHSSFIAWSLNNKIRCKTSLATRVLNLQKKELIKKIVRETDNWCSRWMKGNSTNVSFGSTSNALFHHMHQSKCFLAKSIVFIPTRKEDQTKRENDENEIALHRPNVIMAEHGKNVNRSSDSWSIE